MFPVRAYLSARSPIDSFLLDHPLVFVMGANPDPNKVRAIFYGKRPVIDSRSRCPKLPDFFEMKRGMGRVLLQQFKILFRCPLDSFWEIIKAFPETTCCPMHSESSQETLCFFIKGFLD